MTAAVTAVQAIPTAECRGRNPAASTQVDWTARYTASAANAAPMRRSARR